MVASLTLTVTRAVDGTSATSHNAGAFVRHVSSGRDFSDSRTHENSTEDVHGVTGVGNDIVGTTSTQTLENKTLDHATGTLERVDIFNTGSWTTTLVGDSANPTLARFKILDNEINLNSMVTFDQNGGMFSTKKAAETDTTFRFLVTDSDGTTPRWEVLSGGTLSVFPTAATTKFGIAVRTTESNSEAAFTVCNPDGTNQRFAVNKDGAVITTSTVAATGNISTGGTLSTTGGGTISTSGTVSAGTGSVTGTTTTNELAVTTTTWSTFTVTVSGGGAATFTTTDGFFYKIGKIVFYRAYWVVGVAGTGATVLTVTMPSTPFRSGNRQSIPGGLRDGGSVTGPLVGLVFAGGSGATLDRMVLRDGTDAIGTSLTAGSIWVLEGWYREA